MRTSTGSSPAVLDVALHQRDVRVAVDLRLIGDHAELAVSGGHHGLGQAPHVALVRHAVADEFGDGQHLHVVLAAELGELRHARHGAIVVHDLADDACGNQSCQPREIDGGFGLAGAHQHSAFAGAQREDVAGTREIVGPGRRIDGDPNGVRAIVGRDAGRDAVFGVDGFGERGAEVGGVLRRHLAEPEIVEPLLGHGEADQAAADTWP